MKALASSAIAMPLLSSNSEAEIILNSSLAGTVVSWNATPSVNVNLFGSVGFAVNTRATALGQASAGYFVGAAAAWNGAGGGMFRRGGTGLNAAFLGAAGATFNGVGSGSSGFANLNLGFQSTPAYFYNSGNVAFAAVNGPKYLMFKFDNAGTDNFGWLEITQMTGASGSVNNYSVTLGNFAYDNTGAALANGVGPGSEPSSVPEPSTVAWLMMGAMVGGARLLRRARNRCAS